MSEPTVVVVESGEPAAVQAEENAAEVTVALVAGAAAVAAEEAQETAEEALAVAEQAVVVAEAAVVAEVRCCEHCEEHAMRLAALEGDRAGELEVALEEELAAPAPEIREEPKPRPKKEKTPEPAARGGFWPL